MIFYLASYPRSGNSWVRRLLRNHFRYMDSPIHGDPVSKRAEFLQQEWPVEGHFDLVDYPPVDPDHYFARYVSRDPELPPRRLLMPGLWKRFLDPVFRQTLANLQDALFIKTHLDPYQHYFDGEFVIQPLRHPGAALWSYYHYQRDVERLDIELNSMIRGREGYGCWSRYHRLWTDAAAQLGERCIRVRYEDLFGHELDFCRRLSEFSGLPLVSDALKPFSFYRQRLPQIARSGQVDDWSAQMTDEQQQLLWECHGEQMVALGYRMPERAAG